MTDHERKTMGEILCDLDLEIDGLDRRVFDAAHIVGHNLDRQRDRAMSPDFQPPIKQQRDRKMNQRNVVARLLGFGPRQPHDLSERDYVVQPDGALVPKGTF